MHHVTVLHSGSFLQVLFAVHPRHADNLRVHPGVSAHPPAEGAQELADGAADPAGIATRR